MREDLVWFTSGFSFHGVSAFGNGNSIFIWLVAMWFLHIWIVHVFGGL
jgi:hypothetical protein